MSISEELLDKYFKGHCTPEEKLMVSKFLREMDELPEHLLTKSEWDDVSDANIPAAKTEEMFNRIKRKTQPGTYRLKWFKIISGAAAVLVILTIGLVKLKNYTSSTTIPAVVNNQLVQINRRINWKSVVNYTEDNQLITLPDSSTVKIYPGGELRYTVPFVRNKREVYLKGKSFFQVAKDKSHPFVVYAKGISTTALGTSFTITALKESKFIKVQLHTGKVWVKNTDSIHQVIPFSKILLPGNQLVYNSKLNKVRVSDFSHVSGPSIDRVSELNFVQAQLVDVFARLEKHYKVKISYQAADLTEMSFTGNLDLTQSLDEILGEIAELNKLKQTKTASGYLISK